MACGAPCASTTPGPCASIASACCAATPTRPAPTCACTPGSTPWPPTPSASARPPTAHVVGETEHTLAAGSNDIEWSLDIASPRLWWPHTLGGQPLTEVRVEVVVDGEVSDRHVAADRAPRGGVHRLGVLDQRRAAVPQGRQPRTGPTRARRCQPPALVRADVERAVEAGLDALRVQAHIATDDLYTAADELGVVLLQDFPLQWGYGRHVRREAVHQAREAVSALGHHPSIIQWCAHDEPVADAPQLDGDSTRTPAAPVRPPAAADVEQVGARSLGQAGVRAGRPDAARRSPTAGCSPTSRSSTEPTATCGSGWHRGEVDELAERARALPRLVRFVSEFGAQSVPESAGEFVDAIGVAARSTGTYLAEHHGLEADVMRARHPPEQYPSFAAWRRATQRYQADLLRRHIETLRRLKYRPTGGFCFSWLADAMPMISASVLDHDRAAEAGVGGDRRGVPSGDRRVRRAAGRRWCPGRR